MFPNHFTYAINRPIYKLTGMWSSGYNICLGVAESDQKALKVGIHSFPA